MREQLILLTRLTIQEMGVSNHVGSFIYDVCAMDLDLTVIARLSVMACACTGHF